MTNIAKGRVFGTLAWIYLAMWLFLEYVLITGQHPAPFGATYFALPLATLGGLLSFGMYKEFRK